MKTFSFTAIIATILFICTQGIQAQTKPTSPANINQFELIKQLHNKLTPEIKQPFDENKPQLPQGFENLQNPEILKTEKANRLKSATADGQKLDSVITETWNGKQWNPTRKEEFLYDKNGNMIFNVPFWWDEVNSQWIEGYNKTQYIYDSNGNMTESRFHVLSEKDNCTVYNWQTTYDSIGNIVLETMFSRQCNSEQWRLVDDSRKYEYNYNANGKTTLRINYRWTEGVSQWETYGKDEYIYDAKGNLILHNSYNDNNLWIGKEETTYDTNGKITLQIGYYWDSKTGIWVNNSKDEYNYNTSGNQTIRLYYVWYVSSNQWSVLTKNETTYDTNGNITSTANYDWNSAKSQWVGGGKNEYSFDTNGNKTLEISYLWDDSTTDWVAYSKTKSTYYYSDHTATFIPNAPAPHITLYPNPAKDFVVFDLSNGSEPATIELYDIQGKKVIQHKLTGTKQIAVGNLPKGLYLYRLTDGEKIYTGKLVVE